MGNKLKLYAYEFYNWVTKGDLINNTSISEIGLIPFYGRIVTKKGMQKVWLVTSFPVNMENINVTNLIIGEARKKHPRVKVNFNLVCEPIKLPIGAKDFIDKFQKSNSEYEQYKSLFENELSESERITGKVVRGGGGRKYVISPKKLVQIKERYDSYKYIAEHIGSGGETTVTNFFIHAHAENKHDLYAFENFLEGLLRSLQIYFIGMNGNMDTYLESYCPAGYKKLDTKNFPQMLLTDANIASLLPYDTHGLVGGSGVPFGVDYYSNLPVLADLFNSGQGQVIGTYGITGSGKTFILQHIALALLAEKVHISALDLKGGEWTKLFTLVHGKLIAMEGENSRFVNTLRIDDMVRDGLSIEDGKAIYDMAFNGTVNLLDIMCNITPSEGNSADVYRILSNAVKNVYNQAGVYKNNPDTFARSRNLKYEDVQSQISKMIRTPSYSTDESLMNLIVKRLSMFLSQDGNFADIFQREITINEVLNEPLVVYSLNKNAENTYNIIDTVRIFMIQYLDTKKQSLRKLEKKHSVVFYEELQRCNQFGKLLKYISDVVTGSRSNNVKVFLLFNSLATLDHPDCSALKSNISSWIIGKVNKTDFDKFLYEYDMLQHEDLLRNVKDDINDKHLFFANINTGVHSFQTLLRVQTPRYIQNALRTVDGKI